jgi:hypothetical protein
MSCTEWYVHKFLCFRHRFGKALSNRISIVGKNTQEIYPSTHFHESYDSNTPELYAAIVAGTFVVVAIMFFLYDVAVTKRNENLVAKAAQSNAIVSVRRKSILLHHIVPIVSLSPLLVRRYTKVTIPRVHQKPSHGRKTC